LEEYNEELNHKIGLLTEQHNVIIRALERKIENNEAKLNAYEKELEETKGRLRIEEASSRRDKEGQLAMAGKLTEAMNNLHRAQVLLEEKEQQIKFMKEAVQASELQSMSLQHANHELERMKKESEERGT